MSNNPTKAPEAESDRTKMFKGIAYDSIIYALSKFALHRGVPHMVHNINISDVAIYAVSDFAYRKWIDKWFEPDYAFWENTKDFENANTWNHNLERALSLSAETSVLLFLFDEKSRIIDNIGVIFASEAVQIVIDEFKDKKK